MVIAFATSSVVIFLNSKLGGRLGYGKSSKVASETMFSSFHFPVSQKNMFIRFAISLSCYVIYTIEIRVTRFGVWPEITDCLA